MSKNHLCESYENRLIFHEKHHRELACIYDSYGSTEAEDALQ